MNTEVMLLIGAGQIGMAIARRMGYGKKIVVGDRTQKNAESVSRILNEAGFDTSPVEMDLSSRESILNMIAEAQKFGEISMLVNAAGVSPSQAPIETILRVDLYGTALLLEEVGKVIGCGGVGVTISSQSGHRMPALTPEEDELLATTPTDALLALDMLQPEPHPRHPARLPDGETLQREACHGGGRKMGRTGSACQFHLAGYHRNTFGYRRVQRSERRILQEHVRQMSGRSSRNGRRSGQCRRTTDERPGSVYHGLRFSHRRRGHRGLFLRRVET